MPKKEERMSCEKERVCLIRTTPQPLVRPFSALTVHCALFPLHSPVIRRLLVFAPRCLPRESLLPQSLDLGFEFARVFRWLDLYLAQAMASASSCAESVRGREARVSRGRTCFASSLLNAGRSGLIHFSYQSGSP